MIVSPHEMKMQQRLEKADYLVRVELLEMAILSNLRGYSYIIDAVLCAVQDETAADAFSTRAYPKIAEERGTPLANVERCIRSAIATGWNRSGEKSLKGRFSRLGYPPSNSEFLRYLYYKILPKL